MAEARIERPKIICGCMICRHYATEAELRARDLLFSCLDDRQKQEAAKGDYITVLSNRGRWWGIQLDDVISNVVALDRGIGYRKWCAYPVNASGMPHHDIWLAQLLTIRTDENKWIDTAHPSGMNMGPYLPGVGVNPRYDSVRW